MFNKSCRWLVSNPGPLVSEATMLPTVPQPQPIKIPNFAKVFLHFLDKVKIYVKIFSFHHVEDMQIMAKHECKNNISTYLPQWLCTLANFLWNIRTCIISLIIFVSVMTSFESSFFLLASNWHPSHCVIDVIAMPDVSAQTE